MKPMQGNWGRCLWVVALLLTGCGGGSSPSPTPDTTPPVITIIGANPASVMVGGTYTDQGATATDAVDGARPVTMTGSVNTSVLGNYTIAYTVTDSHGNTATASRTVNVLPVPDTTRPVITLQGATSVTVQVGSVYVDAGATAYDNVDGNISSSISVTGSVNTAVLGTYTITYNVSDSSGNQATQVLRTVNVVDTTAPVITILGSNPASVMVGDVYTDAGATALDNLDGVRSVTTAGSVNTATLGNYTITYTATDAHGNTATASRTVNVLPVPDTTAPVITLVGGTSVTVQVGSVYVDAGATAYDNVDGNISSSISVSGTVNTAVLGTTTITYNVSDSSGNQATQVVRTVTVVDTTAPVITILGSNPASVMVGDVYTDAGATALDNLDGVLSVVVTGSVNTAVAGTYTKTYTATDAHGNTAVDSRSVKVLPVPDTTAPVITLQGATSVTVQVGSVYTDAGATAYDNVDGNISSSISVTGSVNTAVLGTYTITYNVSDSSGNQATQVVRTVNVVPVPVLATGTILYPSNNDVRKMDLATGVESVVFHTNYSYPGILVPSRNGGRVAMTGSNMGGIWVLTLSPASIRQATSGGDWAPSCSSSPIGNESFDTTPDGTIAVFSSWCTAPTAHSDIVLMKLDGPEAGAWVRVTNDTDRETSPVIGGVDAVTGYITVFFVSNKAGVLGIYKQVIDPNVVGPVGGQTLVTNNVRDGNRAMSISPDFTQLAFMKDVAGNPHIFVKSLVDGTEQDIATGVDPYWATDGSNLIKYTGTGPNDSPIQAIKPDGTGKVIIPLPYAAACDYRASSITRCLAYIVTGPAGY